MLEGFQEISLDWQRNRGTLRIYSFSRAQILIASPADAELEILRTHIAATKIYLFSYEYTTDLKANKKIRVECSIIPCSGLV